MNKFTAQPGRIAAFSLLALAAVMAGCSGSDSGTVTVAGDVPIAYVQRSTERTRR